MACEFDVLFVFASLSNSWQAVMTDGYFACFPHVPDYDVALIDVLRFLIRGHIMHWSPICDNMSWVGSGAVITAFKIFVFAKMTTGGATSRTAFCHACKFSSGEFEIPVESQTRRFEFSIATICVLSSVSLLSPFIGGDTRHLPYCAYILLVYSACLYFVLFFDSYCMYTVRRSA